MFDKLPDIPLFEIGSWHFSLLSLLGTVGVFFIVFFLNRMAVRSLSRFFESKGLSKLFARFIRIGITGFLFFLGLVAIMEILGVKYMVVLNHVVFSPNEKINVKVYNLLILVLIVFFIRLIVYVIEYVIEIRIESKHLDRGRGRSFFQIVKYLVWMIGILIIISSLGFKVTLIIASISALLVGVGFGLQHIFNDLFSGIIILFDGSIEVDDVVEVEGTVGRVLEIGLRVSKLLTRDNVVIIMPNSRFTGEKVINWSHNEEVTRFHVNVGVAYGSDVRLVENILLQCAERHKEIVKNPRSFVRFNDFGESSLDFQLYFWTANDFMVENIKSDLRFDIDDQFRTNNIQIPFPQRDLHLKSKNFEG
ncbi:mechanosensitive ion channel family protein [Sunxiuqinia sp. A32]|uniref:mechanosensitive ion channel family protein n=1 Tax=Sunxiuqinia sp. A32 TaxID=3461496 RepID=UPI0040454E2D